MKDHREKRKAVAGNPRAAFTILDHIAYKIGLDPFAAADAYANAMEKDAQMKKAAEEAAVNREEMEKDAQMKNSAEEAAVNREEMEKDKQNKPQYVSTASSPITPQKPYLQANSDSEPAKKNTGGQTKAAQVTQPKVQITPATPVEKQTDVPAQGAPEQSLAKDKRPPFHNDIVQHGSGCITALTGQLKSEHIKLEARGTNNQTCLHLAAKLTNPDLKASTLVTFLLSRQPALLNLQDDAGNTAAHITLTRETFNPPLGKELIQEQGIDLNLVNNKKETLLHLAISHFTLPTENARDAQAKVKAATDLARYLIEKGANLEITNDEGKTALHLAIQYEKKEIIEALLAKKANPNAQDQEGNKPIHYAVCYMQPEVIKLLSKHSAADLAVTNNAQQTPLHYATMMWNSDWKEKKVAKKIPNLTTWITREAKDIAESTIETLFTCLPQKYASTLHGKDIYGWTPLHWACARDDVEQDKSYMIVFLKNHGANLAAIDLQGNTPFGTAMLLGMPISLPNSDNPNKPISLAKHLLGEDKQNYIQMKNVNGDTALHFATLIQSQHQVRTIEYLLSKGADPFQKNNNGISPYDLLGTVQQKGLAHSEADRDRLKTIKDAFTAWATRNQVELPLFTLAEALPSYTLPAPLKDYEMPWYKLPVLPAAKAQATSSSIAKGTAGKTASETSLLSYSGLGSSSWIIPASNASQESLVTVGTASDGQGVSSGDSGFFALSAVELPAAAVELPADVAYPGGPSSK